MYKVVIGLDNKDQGRNNKYQLDLRDSKFGELIGFEPKLITQTEYGSQLPSIY